MGRIRVLDDLVVNRIAAGEVVERPASVVKELIENSLDAGAHTVSVLVDGGGKQRIRVVDDGSGMDRDDALLALERHATSKVRRFEDLVGLETLGFRGEALPSIAAVSRFLLRTATGDGAGTEIEARGGRVQAVRQIGMPRGTEVEVAALFFNVPARRKFLRADATEFAHVARVVIRQALANPGAHFRLEHGGHTALDVPPADGLRERAVQVLGGSLGKRLIPFEHECGGIRVHGLAGRPADGVPRRDAQHFFVNGRCVQDRLLSHAVAEAYENALPAGRYAVIVLHVDLDRALVDVNVHPQKAEVRFSGGRDVHEAVRSAISSALRGGAAVGSLAEVRAGAAALRFLEAREPAPTFTSAASERANPSRQERGDGPPVPRPLGQIARSFIVADDGQGVMVVDQHAAHERILFDRYLAQAESGEVSVQRLLFPRVVEVSPEEYALIEAETGEFRRLGLLVEPFGGNTVRIDAVPAVAAEEDPESLLRAFAGETAAVRSASAGDRGLRKRLVTTAACHAAIKVPHALGEGEMQRLLSDLFATTNPSVCPHGRPIVFRLTIEDLERAFRRR